MPLTIIIVLQWTVAAFYSNFLAICEWSFHDSRLFTAIGIYISNFRIHNGACWHFASMLPIYLYCHASTTRGGGSTTRDTRNCLWTGRVFREFPLGDLRRRFEEKKKKKKRKGLTGTKHGKTTLENFDFSEKLNRTFDKSTCDVRGHHSRIDCSNIP